MPSHQIGAATRIWPRTTRQRSNKCRGRTKRMLRCGYADRGWQSKKLGVWSFCTLGARILASESLCFYVGASCFFTSMEKFLLEHFSFILKIPRKLFRLVVGGFSTCTYFYSVLSDKPGETSELGASQIFWCFLHLHYLSVCFEQSSPIARLSFPQHSQNYQANQVILKSTRGGFWGSGIFSSQPAAVTSNIQAPNPLALLSFSFTHF